MDSVDAGAPDDRGCRSLPYRTGGWGEGHRQARDGPRRLAACRPPGPRVVYNLDDSNGVGNGSGDSTWDWSTNNTGFWDGPSGPYLWERSDGRFIAADHDAWGDPALIDLVWQGKAAWRTRHCQWMSSPRNLENAARSPCRELRTDR